MSDGEKLRRLGPLLPYVAAGKFAEQYYQVGPGGRVPKVWAEVVGRVSVLGMSTDNHTSLVLYLQNSFILCLKEERPNCCHLKMFRG